MPWLHQHYEVLGGGGFYHFLLWEIEECKQCVSQIPRAPPYSKDLVAYPDLWWRGRGGVKDQSHCVQYVYSVFVGIIYLLNTTPPSPPPPPPPPPPPRVWIAVRNTWGGGDVNSVYTLQFLTRGSGLGSVNNSSCTGITTFAMETLHSCITLPNGHYVGRGSHAASGQHFIATNGQHLTAPYVVNTLLPLMWSGAYS